MIQNRQLGRYVLNISFELFFFGGGGERIIYRTHKEASRNSLFFNSRLSWLSFEWFRSP